LLVILVFCFFPLRRGALHCECSSATRVAAATSHEKTLGKPTTQKAEIRPREREREDTHDFFSSSFVKSHTSCCLILSLVESERALHSRPSSVVPSVEVNFLFVYFLNIKVTTK